ncbi:MAG: 16S rRNA (cytosine(1402)-N(4))-methyltransferase RsmH [Rhodospirillaceae bacterium]|nr:MAG: 16S rRNA (cytosine(1402)-N(4))-methyltransferase RsmH [Rhodospirillaceae bacterium]
MIDVARPGDSTSIEHIPVLLAEVLEALIPREGGVYVDGTFGGGGYTTAILDAAACTVWGIDRDPQALARGDALVERFADRLHLVAGRFGDMAELLNSRGVAGVDGVALDLGVSSMQIEDRTRGFSFLRDGPLDMRMENSGRSAADIINAMPEKELSDIIFTYGEERHARRVARAIVAARSERPISRTLRLADIIRAAVRRAHDGIDPATRTFQALRIYVNDELGELQRGLLAAERLLKPGGRLAVVSFHSLEDRIVKTFLRARSQIADKPSRHSPANADQAALPRATFLALARRPIVPSAGEVARNPRARSARLRTAERTSASAFTSIAGGRA